MGGGLHNVLCVHVTLKNFGPIEYSIWNMHTVDRHAVGSYTLRAMEGIHAQRKQIKKGLHNNLYTHVPVAAL